MGGTSLAALVELGGVCNKLDVSGLENESIGSEFCVLAFFENLRYR